jgi:hypothetical protein
MSDKNQSLKCSQQVRNIPLERYRLPDDGRKWKQAARSRSALLVRLSSYANGDGTFVRNGRNYSPSLETLEKHIAQKSFYRLTDALQSVGLLSWTREKHYDRRIYTINLPEPGVTFNPEQVSDSEKPGVTFASEDPNQVSHSPEQVSDSPEQVSYSPKTGVTMGDHPSLPSCPSKAPSGAKEEREPSSDEKPNLSPSLPSPAAAETKDGGQEKISDAEIIQGKCYDLTGKTPKPEHVEKLLQRFSRAEIEYAFEFYVDGLQVPGKGNTDTLWAEKVFFADGGGAAMIQNHRISEWKDNLEHCSERIDAESFSEYPNGDDIDAFLARDPVPAGVTDSDVLIKQARKRRVPIVRDWLAAHPPCAKCGERDNDPLTTGMCFGCLHPSE